MLPAFVVTVMVPDLAPAGTVTTICVALSLSIFAVVPLKDTLVAFFRLAPWIVTSLPTRPAEALNETIAGDVALKIPPAPGSMSLSTLPHAWVYTVIGPVMVLAGTVTVTVVALALVTNASVPWKPTR